MDGKEKEMVMRKRGSFGDSNVGNSVLFTAGDLDETASSRHWKIDERGLHTVIRCIRNAQLAVEVPSKRVELPTISDDGSVVSTTRDTDDVLAFQKFDAGGDSEISVSAMAKTAIAAVAPGVKGTLDGESSSMVRASTDLLDVERVENGNDDGVQDVVHHSDPESSTVP